MLRRRLLLGALFVVVVLLMYRPTPELLRTTLPANIGDPALTLWMLLWGNHVLLRHPLRYFDANFFWPHHTTLAYSEMLLPIVPVFGVLYRATRSALLAFNLCVLLLALLSLAGTYCLARRLTGRADAAVLSAFAYSFSGFVFIHIGHIQLLTLGLFPLAFLLLFRLLAERRMLLAVGLALVSVTLFTSALYFGAIYVVCTAAIIGGHLLSSRDGGARHLWRCLAATGALSAVLLAPVLIPYFRLQTVEGLSRQLQPAFALRVLDFVSPAPGSYLYASLADANLRRRGGYVHAFFPGFSTIVLAVVGLVALARGVEGAAARRREICLLLGAGVVAALLALGPDVHGWPGPFLFFHAYVPGFARIRATARFAVPTLLAVAVIAGLGFTGLTSALSRGGRVAAAIVVGTVLLAELAAPFPRELLPLDQETIAVYRALRDRPPGAVAELPIVDLRTQPGAWAYIEAPRMVYASVDWKPRFNGYSGDWPADYLANLEVLNTFPAPAAIERARSLHLRYVVLHVGPYHRLPQLTETEADARITELPRGATATRHGRAWLVDLGGRPSG